VAENVGFFDKRHSRNSLLKRQWGNQIKWFENSAIAPNNIASTVKDKTFTQYQKDNIENFGTLLGNSGVPKNLTQYEDDAAFKSSMGFSDLMSSKLSNVMSTNLSPQRDNQKIKDRGEEYYDDLVP